ncbi:MAG TPA: PEP-CTERM sorting domain-containing protein [bacterium]|nr:PEP-CTERM sorting domain-containing protein [bacterium]
MRSSFLFLLLLLMLSALPAAAGPFTETGIDKDDPAIVAWASGYVNYLPADDVDAQWRTPEKTLGPATGDLYDVAALGERALDSPDPPGEITLSFAEPLRDREGADLVVFENSFPLGEGLFIELGFVEVSSDGAQWARFPSVSLTPGPVGDYGLLDPSDLHNLAGKFQNAFTVNLGTPFDLAELQGDEAVVDGLVDLQDIRYVKIVDAPGGGDYYDNATALGYDDNHPIYDAHPTYGSGGFDLEAVGALDMSLSDPSASDDDDDDLGDDDDWRDDEDDDDDDAGGCA